jgi:hypothetical protein
MRFAFVRCAYVGRRALRSGDRVEVLLHRLNLAIAKDEEEMLSGVTDAGVICV